MFPLKHRDVVHYCSPYKNRLSSQERCLSLNCYLSNSVLCELIGSRKKCRSVLHTEFLTQHNISIKTAEPLLTFYPKMFPDSKIAKKVSIAAERKRTCPCILNKALACPVVEGICM